MKYFDETSKERITNLKNLLDNFEKDKEISENNSKKYLKKNKPNQQLHRKNENLFDKKLK